MDKIRRFSKYVLIFAVLHLNSSCQRDNDELELIENVTDISALPDAVIFPNENLNSEAKFELGRTLFWDPILSGSKGVSCATCHHPDFGYADGRDLSSGVNGIGLGPDRTNGVLVKRNSPTIVNTAFNGIDLTGNYNSDLAPMFWDNRASGLEEQALLPILSKEEMRGTTIPEDNILDTVIQRLIEFDEYRTLFDNAFGSELINVDLLTQALATFQRNIVANNSPFDNFMRGDQTALNNQQIEGMNTFIEVGCIDCHNGPMFSDYQLHTLSVPNHPLVDDSGATGNFDFRTPSLRNLALTAPYMHNGHFDNLQDVLEFYNDISRGNGDSQNANVNDNEISEEA